MCTGLNKLKSYQNFETNIKHNYRLCGLSKKKGKNTASQLTYGHLKRIHSEDTGHLQTMTNPILKP